MSTTDSDAMKDMMAQMLSGFASMRSQLDEQAAYMKKQSAEVAELRKEVAAKKDGKGNVSGVKEAVEPKANISTPRACVGGAEEGQDQQACN